MTESVAEKAMYLRSIELVGFKSFVLPTKLEFGPGMAAIVGPNGCGKSNIVDAIRWVLGEQSAKTLRGAKMEDFIFNGTDDRKPLGLAEVSITFADCEKALGTEYNEMTVTRRVYRSGEGEYFINRTLCRLKDIQRLFMNTGIGTSSYSIMEQGRIDQILSSRPEDRREVFEEASGITKFKADKREAVRKLEQTEANLLRLADVITEVKRQIVSLQRQAGKARRFKVLREELRALDMFSARERIGAADKETDSLKARLTAFSDQLEAAHADLQQIEQRNAALRRQLSNTDGEIEALMGAHSEAQTRLNRAQDTIRMNTERIAESRLLSEQEREDIARTSGHIKDQQKSLEKLESDLAKALSEHGAAEKKLREKTDAMTNLEGRLDSLRKLSDKLQAESVELESSYANLQNELMSMDSERKSDVVRRERLGAERVNLEKETAKYEERIAATAAAIKLLDKEAAHYAEAVAELERLSSLKNGEEAALRSDCLRHETQVAVLKARLEMSGGEAKTKESASGADLLLDEANPLRIDRAAILGRLSDELKIEPGYELPLQSVLRSWFDAVLVTQTEAALKVLEKLESHGKAAALLMVADAHLTSGSQHALPIRHGERLVNRIKCSAKLRPMVERLLGNAIVVDSVAAIPSPLPYGSVYVTRQGAVARGEGSMEFSVSDIMREAPELRRKLADLAQRIEAQGKAIEVVLRHKVELAAALAENRNRLDKQKHDLAVKEGERDMVCQEAARIRERLSTVTWEIEAIDKESGSTGNRKEDIAGQMEEAARRRAAAREQMEIKVRQLRAGDEERTVVSSELMEARLRSSELSQRVEFMGRQVEPARERLAELEDSVSRRSRDSVSRAETIARLEKEIEAARGEISTLEATAGDSETRLNAVRTGRQTLQTDVERLAAELEQKHAMSDEIRDLKADLEVKHAEARMKRQNLVDRLGADYGVTLEDVLKHPEPEWENGQRPEPDWIDTRIAELRAKIEAMGPVNLVAIEEYQQLEERHTFLNQQREDLLNSKRKLLIMINQINKTTSQMFADTFAQINANFDTMFRKLFNGGSAKLVLVDEEDMLESGIEIIARPPGKRLQNVSLLSGGERTMTAVSLLFAIYMVKPSPFCILDELDAPLDDSNIGRFVKILQDFLHQSQFLVITHNQRTIAAGDVLYGVTMEEKGVSKVVSLKFPERKQEEDLQAAAVN